MKYFGQISNGQDIATKSYVDNQVSSISGDGFTTTTSVQNLPITKKHVIVSIPTNGRSQTLSLYENLSTGGELFLYIKSLTDGINVMIPISLGGYPVSYCGYYNSSTASSYLIPLRYSAVQQSGVTVITRTTVTLHIFFDGSMYYIDRFFTYSGNSDRE